MEKTAEKTEKETGLPDKEFCEICRKEIITHMTNDGGERV